MQKMKLHQKNCLIFSIIAFSSIKEESSVLSWHLVAKERICSGPIVRKGYKSTIDKCASSCGESSKFFYYGRGDDVCRNNFCICRCKGNNPEECIEKQYDDFDLYSYEKAPVSYRKLPNAYCSNWDTLKKFSTIELAKNQCSLNNDCKAVLDLNCQGKSDAFYLCDYESIVAHNNFGCIYQKYRGYIQQVFASSNPKNGPTVTGNLSVERDKLYQIKIEIKKTDTEGRGEYANIEFNDENIGKCDPGGPRGDCTFQICSNLTKSHIKTKIDQETISFTIKFTNNVDFEDAKCLVNGQEHMGIIRITLIPEGKLNYEMIEENETCLDAQLKPVKDINECKDVTKNFALKFDYSKVGHIASWWQYPKGCIYSIVHKNVQFNQHETGKRNQYYRPICRIDNCPLSCKNCTTGGASDGGRAVNAEGICEHFCSVYGHCGSGENYKNGHDCSNCKQDTSTTVKREVVTGTTRVSLLPDLTDNGENASRTTKIRDYTTSNLRNSFSTKKIANSSTSTLLTNKNDATTNSLDTDRMDTSIDLIIGSVVALVTILLIITMTIVCLKKRKCTQDKKLETTPEHEDDQAGYDYLYLPNEPQMKNNETNSLPNRKEILEDEATTVKVQQNPYYGVELDTSEQCNREQDQAEVIVVQQNPYYE